MAPIKEESQHLLSYDEKVPEIEVYEVEPMSEISLDAPRKRPLWRRLIRAALTIFAVGFFTMTVVPLIMSPFVGCGMRHHQDRVSFDPDLAIVTLSQSKPKTHFEFASDIDKFFIKQETQKRIPGPHTDVDGRVVLTASDEVKHVTVDFDIQVTDTRLWKDIKIQAQENGVVFSADPFSLVDQQVNITAHVTIPRKAELKTFSVDTRGLNIVANARFGGCIDKMYLESISGNIHTADIGKDGDRDHDYPLVAKWIKISSVSGNIKGGFGLVKGVSVKTTSGDIDVAAYPADWHEEVAHIYTRTVSGKSNIHVVHPLYARALKSEFNSVSGVINARLPEEWQGSMSLSTTSGLFDVKGKSIKIVKKEKSIGGLYWKLIKGDGNSSGKIQSVSGDVNVSVGNSK